MFKIPGEIHEIVKYQFLVFGGFVPKTGAGSVKPLFFAFQLGLFHHQARFVRLVTFFVNQLVEIPLREFVKFFLGEHGVSRAQPVSPSGKNRPK
jgi:hypothetical protein